MGPIERAAARFVSAVEESPASLGRFAAGGAAVLAIRLLLEHFSSRTSLRPETVVHYACWFAAMFTSLVVVMRWLGGPDHLRVGKVVMAVSPLILVAPLVDLAITSGRGVPMGYIPVRSLADAARTYLAFGGSQGMTPGIKVEVVLVFLFGYFYYRVKTGSYARTILAGVVVYTMLYLLGILPALVGLLGRALVGPSKASMAGLAGFLYLVALVNVLGMWAARSRAEARLLMADLRPERVLHYLLMAALGVALLGDVNIERDGIRAEAQALTKRLESARASHEATLAAGAPAAEIASRERQRLDLERAAAAAAAHLRPRAPEDERMLPVDRLPLILLLPLSIVLAAVFAIVENNVEDLPIDRVSNPWRPLPRGTITEGPYRRLGRAALCLSILTAAVAGFPCLSGILLVTAGYHLYSSPPFRLKRVPLLSKGILGMNAFFMLLTGFTAFGGDIHEIPGGYILFTLVGVSLASNFVDLKDVEGDRVAGIRTLPVLMGSGPARLAIAAFTVVAYGLGYAALQAPWVLGPIAGLLALHLWALFRTPFREGLVFSVYSASIAGMIGIIVLT